MTGPAEKLATYADLEAVPPHLVAEIIDGRLVTHPRPSFRHGGAASGLGIVLGAPFQYGMGGGPGGWIFIDEPQLHFAKHVVVPDIAGWRRETLGTYPDGHYTSVVPDWACEVLSASTEIRDRTSKMRVYGQAGIPYLWIVDPRIQLLEVFENKMERWTKIGGWNSADQVRAPPFEAISFSLADLWPLDQPLGFNEDPTPLYAGDR